MKKYCLVQQSKGKIANKVSLLIMSIFLACGAKGQMTDAPNIKLHFYVATNVKEKEIDSLKKENEALKEQIIQLRIRLAIAKHTIDTTIPPPKVEYIESLKTSK